MSFVCIVCNKSYLSNREAEVCLNCEGTLEHKVTKLESQNKKLIEALRESVQLLEDGCLMYDQHVPSGSSSFRSDAQWFIDTTRAVLKEVYEY